MERPLMILFATANISIDIVRLMGLVDINQSIISRNLKDIIIRQPLIINYVNLRQYVVDRLSQVYVKQLVN